MTVIPNYPYMLNEIETLQAQVASLTVDRDRMLAVFPSLTAERDRLLAQVAALQAENGRLRMRAEVGRSVCPWCGGEEEHQSDCELREGGQP